MTTRTRDEFNEQQAKAADRAHAGMIAAWNMGRKQVPPVTQQQLAAMFGVTRTRVQYILQRARKRGFQVAG